jgi:hypothetical protein
MISEIKHRGVHKIDLLDSGIYQYTRLSTGAGSGSPCCDTLLVQLLPYWRIRAFQKNVPNSGEGHKGDAGTTAIYQLMLKYFNS